MKLRAGIRVLLLCLMLLLVLAGCGEETPPETVPPATEEPITQDNAPDRYTKAHEQLCVAPNLTAAVSFVQTRQVNGETFSEKVVSTMSCKDVGTSQVAAVVKQDVTFGEYQTQYAEYYTVGSGYCKVNDTYFRAKGMTWKIFSARQYPLALLDATNYDSITMKKTEGTVELYFAVPNQLESWACTEEDAVLISAAGTAVMDDAGNLLRTTYSARYSIDETMYQLDVTSDISLESSQTMDADLLAIQTDCAVLTYFDAPRIILQVVGDVYTAQAMSVEYTESLYSAAYARRRSQTSSFDTYGSGQNFMARSRYEVSLLDYSNTAQINSEVVTFLDGSCVSSINDGEPELRDGITAQQMREYCEDSILAALFTPNNLLDAELSENDEFICIRFVGNDAFVTNLLGSIYSMFGANLDHYAQSYTTPTAGGYLCINKHTGLPTALGISVSRIHVIDGVSCALNYQLDQAMQLSSATAYETITGDPLPSTESVQTATPLLYRVTNEEGKTMWLMGTIHAGDIRMTRLPQQVYTAFSESTALAVEFDIHAFAQSAQVDPVLQAQLSQAYYYSDGTRIDAHLDPQLLARLQDMMLISGSNDTNSQYYRTVLWWNMLNDFYLRQDPQLSANMGLDRVLMEMALAEEKPILEIESGLSQIQTLAGLSDELQAMLLEEILNMNSYSYSQKMHEEYEAWCRGDMEALLQMLLDDQGLTEEQRLLMEEYRQVMFTDRNAGMLDKALEYLSGEETVFYAVGYGHLLGESGLIEGLQNAGYTVELVSYTED